VTFPTYHDQRGRILHKGETIMTRTLTSLLAVAVLAATSRAEVKTKEVDYSHGKMKFKGLMVWDDSVKGKRPGVLVIHEWWGLNKHAKDQAEKLAKLGYVAFACDMYGEGKVTEHPKEAKQMSGEVRANLESWQGRAKAGLEQLKKFEKTDPTRLAAIGYCFGGSTALQLAYTGADLKAVATFHAALPTPKEKEAKAIKAKLVINHGAADSFIPDESIAAFRKKLDDAGVSYKFIAYPGAKHSFTVPHADKVGNPGMAYDEKADKGSWQAMRDLFKETLDAK